MEPNHVEYYHTSNSRKRHDHGECHPFCGMRSCRPVQSPGFRLALDVRDGVLPHLEGQVECDQDFVLDSTLPAFY